MSDTEYTKEEVETLIDEIGTKLWNVDEAIEKGIKTDKKIFFHPWIMKSADEHRKEVWFIDDPILKSNVSYELMILDFYDWFLSRFGIEALARELLIKNAIGIYGNIIDAISVYIAKKIVRTNENMGFKRASNILVEHNIISKEFRKSLIDEIWSIRNKQHIGTLQERELEWYNDDNYEITKELWEKIKKVLSEAKRNGIF